MTYTLQLVRKLAADYFATESASAERQLRRIAAEEPELFQRAAADDKLCATVIERIRDDDD